MKEPGRGRLVIRGVTFMPEQLTRLDAIATRLRRSRSFLIRDAIEDALAPFGVTITEQHLPPARVLELLGTV